MRIGAFTLSQNLVVLSGGLYRLMIMTLFLAYSAKASEVYTARVTWFFQVLLLFPLIKVHTENYFVCKLHDCVHKILPQKGTEAFESPISLPLCVTLV